MSVTYGYSPRYAELKSAVNSGSVNLGGGADNSVSYTYQEGGFKQTEIAQAVRGSAAPERMSV